MGYSHGGSMSPMCGAEGIVNKYFCQSGQGFGKGRVVFLLFRMEPKVFQHKKLTLLHISDELFNLRPDAVGGHLYLLTEHLREPLCYRGQARLFLGALGTSQMGTEDDLSFVIKEVFYGRY